MYRKSKLPELLAPAGDFECLLAAVEAGADAVYVGGESFGARAYAKNFSEDELRRAAVYCHLHRVKLYVTVNTLLDDREVSAAVEFASRLRDMGVDALIVADMGLVRLLRRRLPDMELHGSTQMSVHNSEGAAIAYEAGCSRVVLARECSAEDIRRITEKCSAEIEIFLHGALCVSHSGQCLFSSLIGGRSGNRGECAQPCRLPYNGGKYPLSLKDLSLARHIPTLIESGAASLKIEGRMKSPDYVYTVTSIYRRLLDEGRGANEEELAELRRAFSRQGFTDGYYTGKLASGMTGVRSEEDKRATRAVSSRSFSPLVRPLRAVCKIRSDIPSELTLSLEKSEISYTATGAVPEAARSAPLTAEGVGERLGKLGGTFFTLPTENITVELDGGLNLSPASLNALRRECVQGISDALAAKDPWTCSVDPCEHSLAGSYEKTEVLGDIALFYEPKLLEKMGDEALSGFDCIAVPLHRLTEVTGRANAVSLPPVIMENELPRVEKMLDEAAQRGIKYCIVTNIGQLSLLRRYGFTPIGDMRLNITNSSAKAFYAERGIWDITLSAELDRVGAARIGGRATVYGRIPLMLTERCFMKDSFGCKSCSACALTDRRGEKFPMIREFEHRNLILNSHLTYMGDRQDELGRLGKYFIFTDESAEDALRVIRAFRKGAPFPLNAPFRRLGRR